MRSSHANSRISASRTITGRTNYLCTGGWGRAMWVFRVAWLSMRLDANVLIVCRARESGSISLYKLLSLSLAFCVADIDESRLVGLGNKRLICAATNGRAPRLAAPRRRGGWCLLLLAWAFWGSLDKHIAYDQTCLVRVYLACSGVAREGFKKQNIGTWKTTFTFIPYLSRHISSDLSFV